MRGPLSPPNISYNFITQTSSDGAKIELKAEDIIAVTKCNGFLTDIVLEYLGNDDDEESPLKFVISPVNGATLLLIKQFVEHFCEVETRK